MFGGLLLFGYMPSLLRELTHVQVEDDVTSLVVANVQEEEEDEEEEYI